MSIIEPAGGKMFCKSQCKLTVDRIMIYVHSGINSKIGWFSQCVDWVIDPASSFKQNAGSMTQPTS